MYFNQIISDNRLAKGSNMIFLPAEFSEFCVANTLIFPKNVNLYVFLEMSSLL